MVSVGPSVMGQMWVAAHDRTWKRDRRTFGKAVRGLLGECGAGDVRLQDFERGPFSSSDTFDDLRCYAEECQNTVVRWVA